MRTRSIITGIVLLGISLTALFKGRELPVGSSLSPEAGFFPLIIAILLGLLSFIYIGKAVRIKDDGKAPSWVTLGGWKRLGLTTGFLFTFAIFFERLGYLVSTFVFVALIWGTIRARRWWVVMFAAIITTLCFYLLFSVLLRTTLPTGILGV